MNKYDMNMVVALEDIYKLNGVYIPRGTTKRTFNEKDIDETPDFYRVRIRNPEDFKQNTFRYVSINRELEIFSVMAKHKGGSNAMVFQSIIFEKNKWEKSKLLNWMNSHEYL